jgi:hypothetical protein
MSLVTGSRPGVKLTYDDFVLFPDDGKRHELIDGEHYVTPSPNLKHQAVSANLLALIWTYLRSNTSSTNGSVSPSTGLSIRTSTWCACIGSRTGSTFARKSCRSTIETY